MKYNLGLVSVSFRGHSPEEILEAMKTCGLTCIEWGSDVHCPPEKAAEIAKLQKAYGIDCCSYGTYFKLGTTPMPELQSYLDAAKTLGTSIVRLWCGDKNSEIYTEDEKNILFALCKEAAAIAQRNDVILCMECHNNTYTNRKEGALELMQAVDSPHFRMYWQPNQYRTEEENLAYARLMSPYTEHLHVFNWKGKERYPLWDARELWKQYLSCFVGEKTLLLEFMPDNDINTLPEEAKALQEIAGGTQ